MKSSPTIIDCLDHPQIWRPWLEPDPSTRSAWLAVWRAMFGLPMTAECLKTFTECTGRAAPATGGYREVYLIVGRRGGKTLFMAITGVYLAAFRKWKGVKGERLVVLLCAVTSRQAKSLFGYVRSLLMDVPALAAMVVRETLSEIDLSNGVSLVIEVADFRSIRGTTICAALVDEISFISSDGVATDKELLVAIKAGMISVPDAILICGSIPSPKTTSELFLEFLPLLNSGRVELLDDKVVINQLCNLERRAGRGRDFIAAGGTGHDDVAVVVAGSIVAAAREDEVPLAIVPWISSTQRAPDRWSPDFGWGGRNRRKR